MRKEDIPGLARAKKVWAGTGKVVVHAKLEKGRVPEISRSHLLAVVGKDHEIDRRFKFVVIVPGTAKSIRTPQFSPPNRDPMQL